MTSIAAARALCAAVSLSTAGLAACSEKAESTTEAGGGDSTTSPSSGGSGGSTSGGGDGGAGGTTSGAGASTASNGGGGSGGTMTGTGGSGGACGTLAQRYGGDDVAEAQIAGAVVDANGGAIVAGEFGGGMAVGAKTLASGGGRDAFVVRLGPGGAIAWANRYGATYDDRVKAIAALPGGGAVVVGTFDGVVDFGGTALTSIAGPDAFVLRLSEAGSPVFVLQLENADARAVAVNDAGEILVAGDFKGMTKFGDVTLTSVQSDVFVARVSDAGAVLAAKAYSFPAKAGALAIAAGAGRTYLTGSFQGSVDFGGGALVSAGSKDVFVARLDDALGAVFAKRFGDDTSQEARSVAVLSDGSAAIAGSFRGQLDLGGTALVADTQDDAFVGRLDENGLLVFALRFGDANVQTARAIAVDASDGLLVGGSFQGTINPGDGPATSAGGEDAFVTWLDPQGVATKTLRWGATLDQRVRSLSVDPCGAVLLGGDFTGTLPIGGEDLVASGALDAFVARVTP